jgi:hypothetical protein
MRANVNYHFAGESEHTQLGEIEIELPPGAPLTIGSRVKLAVGGKAKLGTVEAIQLGASESACPTVTLRLRRPAL